MEHEELLSGSKTFGAYLRQMRESKRLSLDSVEEMSVSYPERVTKSHLSRIENGLAIPSFPRLLALSHIYGVPVSAIAERFELDLLRGIGGTELTARPARELWEEARALAEAGDYQAALFRHWTVLERLESGGAAEHPGIDPRSVALHASNSLLKLGRFEIAKHQVERVLGHKDLSVNQLLSAYQLFATCCWKLGKPAIALIALEEATRVAASNDADPKLVADLDQLRGLVHESSGRYDEAVASFERALASFREQELPFETCQARIGLAGAIAEVGRLDEAEGILQEAAAVSRHDGYARLEARALQMLCQLRYRRGDLKGAAAYAMRSNAIARPRDYVTIVFRNCFYLWKVALAQGDEVFARANDRALRAMLSKMEESTSEVDEFRATLTRGES